MSHNFNKPPEMQHSNVAHLLATKDQLPLSSEQIARLQKESEGRLRALVRYRNSAPLCKTHSPSSGVRGSCLVCALIATNRALSRIDYLTGEPNDMEVSGYDVFHDEEDVVENVKKLRERLVEKEQKVVELERLRQGDYEPLRKMYDVAKKYGFKSFNEAVDRAMAAEALVSRYRERYGEI